MNQDRILQINKKSFITVCLILFIFMLLSYIMTFIIPHGIFEIIKNKAYPIIAINNDTFTIWERLNFFVKSGNINCDAIVPTA